MAEALNDAYSTAFIQEKKLVLVEVAMCLLALRAFYLICYAFLTAMIY